MSTIEAPEFELKSVCRYLNKLISAKSESGDAFEGVLVAFDPVSKSGIILVANISEPSITSEFVLVPRLDLTQVQVLETSQKFDPSRLFSAQTETTLDPAALQDLKEKLVVFLNGHGLSVHKQDSSLWVQNCVTVRAPFRAADCRATNEIVLDRVSSLVASFHAGVQA